MLYNRCVYIYMSIECLIFIGTCFYTSVGAQLTITPSSSTPCYGDVATLVCHHPELATNPGRYLTSTPTWKENGMRITPTVGSVFTAVPPQDLMSTTLTINITVDHFRNKSFYYSCFLVLAGASAGQVETSQNVFIDPIGEWVFRIIVIRTICHCVLMQSKNCIR